jgi:hypothetical protein
MYGRNGADELSRFVCIVALILLVVAMFIPHTINLLLWLVSLGLLIWAYVRIFSRNLYKRQAENARYLAVRQRITGIFRNKYQQFKMRKIYRYFKCPGCKVTIRIPRGKGKVL